MLVHVFVMVGEREKGGVGDSEPVVVLLQVWDGVEGDVWLAESVDELVGVAIDEKVGDSV